MTEQKIDVSKLANEILADMDLPKRIKKKLRPMIEKEIYAQLGIVVEKMLNEV